MSSRRCAVIRALLVVAAVVLSVTVPSIGLPGGLVPTAGAAPRTGAPPVVAPRAAGSPTDPPFAATGAENARDGVRSRPGTVTVTDPTDGPVAIDTTLYLPAKTPAPAVLLSHGFGSTKDSLDGQARKLARAGLVVLTWSAPGFGRSGGSISLMSLDHEIPDARQLIDHLAAQPEVMLDGPGDPRVGVAGGSYGGAASLLVAGTDRRVDAVASAITWNDLAQALFPDDAVSADGGAGTPAPPASVSTAGTGPLKRGWASALFASGLGGRPESGATPSPSATPSSAAAPSPAAGSAQAACGRFRIEYCLAYAGAVSTGRLPVQLRALLARSSPATVLPRVHAPTLLVQGQQDTLFGLDQAEANVRGLVAAGVPVTVRWYAGGHDAGATGQAGIEDLMGAFLADHLRAPAPSSSAPSSPAPSSPAPSSSASPLAAPGFSYDLTGLTDPTTGQTPTRTVQTDDYPITGTARTRQLAVTGGRQQIVRPPGGQPAALTALTGLGVSGLGAAGATPAAGAGTSGNTASGTAASPGAARAAGSALLGSAAAEPAGQTAVFPTAPLIEPLTVTGQPLIRLAVTATGTLAGAATGVAATGAAAGGTGGGDGPLFARLVDVAPDGTRTLVGAGAAPFTVPGLRPGATREVTVALPGAVATIDRGHRLAVSIVPTDASFAFPTTGAAFAVALADGAQLVVPSVPGRGNVDPAAVRAPLPRFPLVGGAALVLLILAAVVVLGARRVRRRRPDPPAGGDAGGGNGGTGPAGPARPDGPTPDPLVVEDLVKSYADGFRAVDGVSFRARPGHVLGLLGPNGAGKTTTLRMLLGLLRPTGGQIRVFGQPVGPGSPVLSRVGAFVEGPGLLPHLTGRGNLRSFWAATGRPAEDADVDAVLAIAGLGSAVDRRVRTYSQGMRQRLAIAQAMLGTPDLLVLDEPTNGLDPPQIAEMRRVLRDYAAAGRTVVVSSHLLAEVEQTCDHVVVMARGKVVADAAVADLVGRSGPTLFEVDDDAAAVRALRALPGVGGVIAVPGPDPAAAPVLSAELGDVSRQSAVAALVAAGVGVGGVRARNRLEDAFLQLVSPTAAAAAPASVRELVATPVGPTGPQP